MSAAKEFMNKDRALQIARKRLLAPAGLAESELERTLGRVMRGGIDSGELYFESARSESWRLEDGAVKDASYDLSEGVGVRAVRGSRTGLAYSDEILPTALLRAAGTARGIAAGTRGGRLQAWKRRQAPALYPDGDPLASLDTEAKLGLLRRMDAEARAMDPRVQQVFLGLSGSHTTILVADSDGTLQADIRPLVRLNVSVLVEQKGRRERGSSGGGGRFGYDYFLQEERASGYVKEAVESALVNLEAEAAPAGAMQVVLGPGWPGILLHEAIGHGLEGDFNRKRISAFSNRLGERVASPACTIVDDGTIPNRRGSLAVDDEGTPAECTVLIERGILRGYMQDKLNAKLMGMQPTGNGRRESYACLTMPRMTNTYMLAGEHAPEEIIASVERGLYATQFGGGQVDITNGRFVFSASSAFLIERGKVTRPVKGATIIGNGPEVLTRIAMVGNDLALDKGIGVCGKEGQCVPVGVGQPTLRIDGITVGGTRIAGAD